MPILGLAELLHVAPPAKLAPARVEDIVNHDYIGQETGLKRPVTLQGLKACRKLVVGQIMAQNWGPSNELIVNRKVRIPRSAKQGRIFGLVVNVSIIGSFQDMMHNISQVNASYPLHLVKVN